MFSKTNYRKAQVFYYFFDISGTLKMVWWKQEDQANKFPFDLVFMRKLF